MTNEAKRQEMMGLMAKALAAGMTRADIAEALNVGASAVSRYAAGKSMGTNWQRAELKRLADAAAPKAAAPAKAKRAPRKAAATKKAGRVSTLTLDGRTAAARAADAMEAGAPAPVVDGERCALKGCDAAKVDGGTFCQAHTATFDQRPKGPTQEVIDAALAKLKTELEGNAGLAKLLGAKSVKVDVVNMAKKAATPKRSTTGERIADSHALTMKLLNAGWTVSAIARAIGMPSPGPLQRWKDGTGGISDAFMPKVKALVGTTPPPAKPRGRPAKKAKAVVGAVKAKAPKQAKAAHAVKAPPAVDPRQLLLNLQAQVAQLTALMLKK